MSRAPFVVTLILSILLMGWLYGSSSEEKPAPKRPERKAEKPKLAEAPKPPPRIYGFPDRRGIVLELNARPGNSCCEATRFRIQSPQFVMWDDGTVVHRTSTYDFRRSKVSPEKAEAWLRTFRAPEFQRGEGGCDEFYGRPRGRDWTSLRGRSERGDVTMEFYGLSQFAAGHAETCAPCRQLRPLDRLVKEISGYQADRDEAMTGLPVEVYLQFRSCGCRNHPDIVEVSKSWPLPGPRPAEICGRGSKSFRLDDADQIQALAQAISRSAAVLDREEIYTCFMRPILDLEPKDSGPLASR